MLSSQLEEQSASNYCRLQQHDKTTAAKYYCYDNRCKRLHCRPHIFLLHIFYFGRWFLLLLLLLELVVAATPSAGRSSSTAAVR